MYLAALDVNIGDKQEGDLVYLSLFIIYSKALKKHSQQVSYKLGNDEKLFQKKRRNMFFKYFFSFLFFIKVDLLNLKLCSELESC